MCVCGGGVCVGREGGVCVWGMRVVCVRFVCCVGCGVFLWFNLMTEQANNSSFNPSLIVYHVIVM